MSGLGSDVARRGPVRLPPLRRGGRAARALRIAGALVFLLKALSYVYLPHLFLLAVMLFSGKTTTGLAPSALVLFYTAGAAAFVGGAALWMGRRTGALFAAGIAVLLLVGDFVIGPQPFLLPCGFPLGVLSSLLAVVAALVTAYSHDGSFAVGQFAALVASHDHETAVAYGTMVIDQCIPRDARLLNDLAWTVVDPARASDRDAALVGVARLAAERAVARTRSRDWEMLDTLALACVAQGERDRAVELELRAIDLAAAAGQTDAHAALNARLEQLRARRTAPTL